MMVRSQPCLVLAAAALFLAPAPSSAQPAPAPDAGLDQEAPTCAFGGSHGELAERASPPDSTSVTIGGDVLKLCYSSPRKRDRDIFGGLVPYDQPWRLGANEPTTLHVGAPVSVGGVELAEGSYAMYAIPGEESWEIVFNAAVDRWGVPISAEVREHDVGALTVTPAATASTVEEMTLELEPSEGGAATLSMAWDDTQWSVPVRPAEGEAEAEEGGRR